ncbi:MAG: tyrosine-type recombinase/integrase, partial [Lacipirellulaceae bacterium]
PPHDSLPAVVDAFLEWTFRSRSAATYKWYRDHLQSFVSKHPRLDFAALRPHHVENWAMVGGENVNTRRNRMRAVKRCLRWAIAQGYLDRNPLAAMEMPTAVPRDVYVPPAEFERLVGFLRDASFADLVRVTYDTGCRPQESLRVEARHVDFENARWVFPRTESKGKRSPRVVYLSEDSLAVTRRLVAAWPSGPLFRNRDGKPWNTYSVSCAFDRLQYRMATAAAGESGIVVSDRDARKLAKTLSPHHAVGGQSVPKSAAELLSEARRKLAERRARELAPRYSLYALRHSWATNALRNGVDPLTVAILMGHSNPSMLACTYQHLSHDPQHLLGQARKAAAPKEERGG